MSNPISISETIQIGKVSTYLSANETDKNILFGGNVERPIPPILIPMVTDALEWAVNGSGSLSPSGLQKLRSYAYWCYGAYVLSAQNIISGPSGGTVIPIPTGQTPNPLDFIVSASSPIVTGESTVTLPQFIGYNVDFVRNSIPQYTTNPADGTVYYNWNKVTGEFTLINGAAFEGERFRIVPTL